MEDTTRALRKTSKISMQILILRDARGLKFDARPRPTEQSRRCPGSPNDQYSGCQLGPIAGLQPEAGVNRATARQEHRGE
jgi:hypothetical protein